MEKVTLDRIMPWQYWLDQARRDRTAARREYRAAKRLAAVAERAEGIGDIDAAEWWHHAAENHRAGARYHDGMARRAIKHVRELWPHAMGAERADR